MKTVKNFLTIADAADRLGVSRQAVRKMFQRYEIEVMKFGRIFVVTNADLKKLQKRRMANVRARGQFVRFGRPMDLENPDRARG